MDAFSALDVGRSGLRFSRSWLDTVAHNIANLQTVKGPDEEPFRAHRLVAEPLGGETAPTGSGVGLREVRKDDRDPMRRYEPGHPLADDDGFVTLPVVELASELSDLMLAQRTYQANLRTIETAREAYEAALRIGQGG